MRSLPCPHAVNTAFSARSAPLPHTVGAAFVRGMLSGLRARGEDCTPWLREAGMATQVLEQDDARVTLQQFALLLRTLMLRRDDETLGLLSRPMRCGSFALQVRAAVAAPNLAQAMRHVAHVFRLLQDDLELVPVKEGGLGGVALQFHNPAVAANPYLHEMLLRVYWRLLAWLVGGRLPAARFDFAYPQPRYAQGYGPIFPAIRRFDAERSAIWFQAEQLALPVCRDALALRRFLAQAPVNVIVPERDRGVAGRVYAYLQQTQPQWPGLEEAARALNMAPSSLQRHLATEHTSFRAQKDKLRCELAVHRLRTTELPLVKIADGLGFADTASFQRAFKAWTGMPAGACRAQGRRGDPA